MPLTFYFSQKDGTDLAVWKIAEDIRFFEEKLQFTTKQKKWLSNLHPHRKLQWLASRYVLVQLQPELSNDHIIRDEFGKPYVTNQGLHCSLSHSGEYAAAILSPVSVGIDIQMRRDKMNSIASRFTNKADQQWLDTWPDTTEILHIIWGAKECMYKAYGMRGVSFREHMYIEGLEWTRGEYKILGSIRKNSLNQQYSLYGQKQGPYYLVYAKKL